jgi:hypothetical protein
MSAFVTLTRAAEAEWRTYVDTAVMCADEKAAGLELLAAIARARANGLHYVSVSINGSDYRRTFRLVD